MQKNVDAADYFNKYAQSGIVKKCHEKYGFAIPPSEWQAKVKYGLAEQLAFEYIALRKIYTASEDSVSSLAFHARNLLELLVWTNHCLADEKNLRAFFEDAGKDGRDIIEAFETWGKATNTDISDLETNNAKERLMNSAKKHGIEDLTGAYQTVSSIASQYPDLSNYYKTSYKILSKFSHPTALTVLGIPAAYVARLRDSFFNVGCFFFSVAIRPLAVDFGVELLNPLHEAPDVV